MLVTEEVEVEEDEDEDVQNLEGLCRDVVEGRGRLDK